MRANVPLFYCSGLPVCLVSSLNLLDKISSPVCHRAFQKRILLAIETVKKSGGS